MPKKKSVLLLIVLFCLVAICAISILYLNHNKSTLEIPEEASEVVEKYMAAYKKGTQYSVEYSHFEDEFARTAYIDSGDKLLDYKIESAEKINDNLYALTIQIKTEQTVFYNGDNYSKVYNFLALIDDTWYFLNGVAHVPLNIQDNLDKSRYVYNDENIVAAEDIVGAIELN
ncbi:MAG: hypothetical protein RRY06_08465 [Lachnospiraceae bacterium]